MKEDQQTTPLDQGVMPVAGPQDDRTTAVLQLYFEQSGDQPTSFSFRGDVATPPAEEDPWTRRVVVSSVWEAPDFGWLLDNVGAVVFENIAVAGRTTQPTKEELEAERMQIIEISFGGVPACRLRPGEFMLFMPMDARSIQVRSLAGDTKMLLAALPGPGA